MARTTTSDVVVRAKSDASELLARFATEHVASRAKKCAGHWYAHPAGG